MPAVSAESLMGLFFALLLLRIFAATGVEVK